MTISEIQKKLKILKKYQREYWVDNKPTVTDYHYSLYLEYLTNEIKSLPESDDKIEFLNIINKIEFPDFNKSFSRIKRKNPFLSIENKFDYESILKWALKYSRSKKENLLVMLKLDGMSVEKEFNLLLTRGSNDGYTGINISHIFPIINIISEKKELNYLRGELLVLKENLLPEFSNERSMVQGIAGRKNIDDTEAKLTLIDFEYYSLEVTLEEFTEDKFKEIIKYFEQYSNVPSDGLVFKIKDEDYFNELGSNNKHPYGICCYKYEDDKYESSLLKIELKIGKERLTPVATIIPVVIDGTTIEHPTMHNAKEIIDKNVCVGDKVMVVKKAGVSPQIESYERTTKSKKQYTPEQCPCELKSKVIYKEPYYYCTDVNCPGKQKRKISACVKILDIKDLGESTIEMMMKIYKVDDIIDVLNLTEFELRQLEGFSNIKTNKMKKIFISTLKQIEDYKILACLNITSIGETIFKDICFKKNMREILSSDIEDFEDIIGISEERSKIIHNGLKNNILNIKKYYDNFKKVISTKGVIKEDQYEICFTGKFPKPKSSYYNIAINKDFNPVDNLTKNTLYLVSDGKESSKVTKARKYEIKILSLNEFLEL